MLWENLEKARLQNHDIGDGKPSVQAGTRLANLAKSHYLEYLLVFVPFSMHMKISSCMSFIYLVNSCSSLYFTNSTMNMPKSSETPRDLRKKLSRSTTSRNILKKKRRETKYEIKKLKNCLSAMTASRDRWRSECKENKVLTIDLKRELSNVTQQCDELISKLKENDSLVSKKKTKLIL
jgi:septal ring factor EnvC (AmiA/AmiB activator)